MSKSSLKKKSPKITFNNRLDLHRFIQLLPFVLLFLSLEVFANTAIFTDSQFTASPYGQNLARQCLNPSHFTDSSQVDFISAPAGRPNGLITYQKNTQPIYTFKATQDRVTGHQSTGAYYHQPHFQNQLNNPQVKRIMVFMGVNDIDFSRGRFSPDGWKEIAQSIRGKGKECVVGLPPMVSNKGRGELIRSYNLKVEEILKNSGCKIVDTSNSLSPSGPYKKFNTGDGLHFTTSSAKEVAKATCEAVKALDGEQKIEDDLRETENQTVSHVEEEIVNEEIVQEASLADFYSSEL